MADQNRNYRALLIGNHRFPADVQELPQLNGPGHDVAALHKALTDPAVGLHSPDQVKVLVNATAAEANEELAGFFENSLAREQLLLYYSGHGVLDLHNRLRLCTRDTTISRLRTRSVRHEFINELIDDCAARSVIVILDCCFSGVAAVKGADPAAQLSGHGRFVMTSSSHAGLSADAAGGGGLSLFTEHLVDGLRYGARGRDGVATVHDVYEYVHTQVSRRGQTPHMKAEGSVGRVPLARRPRHPAEGSTRGEGTVPAVAARTVALDIRPTFTDRDGNRTLLPTDSDFTGVIHVALPQPRTVLTTHRDQIAGASETSPVTAQLWSGAKVRRHDLHVSVTGRPGAQPQSAVADGGVRFLLPEGAGTVTWSPAQVGEFARAKAKGHWPTTTAFSAGSQKRNEDRGYAYLARASLVALGSLAAGILATLLFLAQAALTSSDGSSGGPSAPVVWGGGLTAIGLLSISFACCSIVVVKAKDMRSFRQARRIRRDRTLPVTPMLMFPEIISEKVVPRGEYVAEIKGLWMLLWDEGSPLPTSQDSHSPGPRTPPRLKVPVLHLYDGYAAEFDRTSGAVGPEQVEVIGVPEKGQWVAIRAAHGMLWARGKSS